MDLRVPFFFSKCQIMEALLDSSQNDILWAHLKIFHRWYFHGLFTNRWETKATNSRFKIVWLHNKIIVWYCTFQNITYLVCFPIGGKIPLKSLNVVMLTSFHFFAFHSQHLFLLSLWLECLFPTFLKANYNSHWFIQVKMERKNTLFYRFFFPGSLFCKCGFFG